MLRDKYYFLENYDYYWYRTSRSMGVGNFKNLISNEIGWDNYRPTRSVRYELEYKYDELIDPNGDGSLMMIDNDKIKIRSNLNFYYNGAEIDSESYYDIYKSRVRLNILGHGSVSERYFGDKGSRITIGGEDLDAKKLSVFAQELRNQNNFDCIRLLSCYSGDGGNDSLISKLSGELKMPVKGYLGPVSGYGGDKRNPRILKYGEEETKVQTIQYQLMGRSDVVNEVIKGSGRYKRKGTTVMAGMEFF